MSVRPSYVGSGLDGLQFECPCGCGTAMNGWGMKLHWTDGGGGGIVSAAW